MSPTRILITDDDPGIVDLLSRELERSGYDVKTAFSASECLRKCAEIRPDLLLLDIVLPDQSGMEVCRQIKSNPQLTGTFIILMSGQGEDLEMKVEGLNVGADEYLSKPFPMAELLARVKSMVRIQQAQKALAEAYLGMEEQVEHRTAQLRRANQELRDSEARFRFLSEAALEGIAIQEDGVLLAKNCVFDKMFGLQAGEGLGKNSLFLVAPECRDMVLQKMRERYEEPYEVLGLRLDGTIFPVEVVARNCHFHGRAARVVVVRDISERKRFEEQLRQFPQRLIAVQENERSRFARDLHDSVNQLLSSVRFRIHSIAGQIKKSNKDLRLEIRQAEDFLGDALEEVRRISRNLRPSELDDLGLAAAIRSACAEFKTRQPIEIKLRLGRLARRLPSEIELALYRIVQEALSNVEKHARATRLLVQLRREKAFVELSIQDNGRGISRLKRGRQKRQGFGLENMRERAGFLGGTFSVSPGPDAGTRIVVQIPIR